MNTLRSLTWMTAFVLAVATVACGADAPSGREAPAPATKPAATTEPAPPPRNTEPLDVEVVSVSGPAQKMVIREDARKWLPLKAGETLSEMTIIRTGLGAKVELKFEDRGRVTVNNATKIGLGQLRKTNGRARADLGIKYGTIRASVEGKRSRNDFRIATPVATLSVRGSTADMGFLADSDIIIDADTGQFQMGGTGGSGNAPGGGKGSRSIVGGETGTSGGKPPIMFMMRQRNNPTTDTFGSTGQEKKSQSRDGNTGRNTTTTSSGGSNPVPKVPDSGRRRRQSIVPDDEPGYP